MDQPSSTESNALTLRIKFKSASLEEFISRYGVDVSPGGIFIRTKQPVDVGTTLQFDFTLADGSALLTGLGTVAWVRENDPTRTNNVPGMGLRFDKLTPESQQNHQTILAEKARKEGKPQGTPYPPTAFVVGAGRPSPAPEPAAAAPEAIAKQEALVKPEPSPANFAKTLPAPAAGLAARAQASVSEGDNFEASGKTEISDKPIEELMREAEAAQMAALESASAPAEDFAPKSPLDEWKADAHTLEGVEAPPAPEEVSISDSQAYATGVPEEPPAVTDSGERRPSNKQFLASLLDMGDTSETLAAGPAASLESPADSSSGVPIEVATSDKTEEVSLLPDKLPGEAGEPIDLGTAGAEDEVEEVPSLAETEAALQPEKRKRSSVLVVGAVLFAGAAAFAAVYLLQTKPWERSGELEGPVAIVKKNPAVAPLPVTPPAPAEKAAAAEEAAEKKPAAKEDKQAAAVVAAKAAAEKAATEKAAEKAAAEKAATEKAAAEKAAAEKHAPVKAAAEKLAKAEPEATAAKSTAKAAAKAAAKSSAEPAGPEKPAAVDEEEIYRLSFRSVPIGAEVLIDNEYYARTPCDRRILDPKKSLAITIRREGYEPHERMIGSSDNWVKKGNERVLSISVNLKKIKATEGEGVAPAAGGEGKPVIKPAPDEPYKE